MWNRIAALMALVTAVNMLLMLNDIEARGGRGGGGRSGGGGHTMNRTPTMSRASSRPTAPQVKQRPQTKPPVSQAKVQQSRQTVQQRPSTANRTELRNQVNQYTQSRTSQNIDRQSPTLKSQNFSNQRSNQIAQNRQISDRVSQRLQQSQPDSSHWFNQNFFDQHNINTDYAEKGANLWKPAAWATLATWGSWRWSTPYYYDDEGNAYTITAESSYANPYNTTTTSSQPIQMQPAQITQTTPSTEGDWLPLGVFAVASNANAAAQTNRFIQLAINRNGEIAGVLYNSTTDTAQDLIGMVDSNSQKAYWSLDNRTDSPIASTGIYNLTEDQTPINVHFSNGSDQIWTLVRLQQGQ